MTVNHWMMVVERRKGGREGGRGDDTYICKTVEIIIKRNLPVTAMVVKGLCTVHNLLLRLNTRTHTHKIQTQVVNRIATKFSRGL